MFEIYCVIKTGQLVFDSVWKRSKNINILKQKYKLFKQLRPDLVFKIRKARLYV